MKLNTDGDIVSYQDDSGDQSFIKSMAVDCIVMGSNVGDEQRGTGYLEANKDQAKVIAYILRIWAKTGVLTEGWVKCDSHSYPYCPECYHSTSHRPSDMCFSNKPCGQTCQACIDHETAPPRTVSRQSTQGNRGRLLINPIGTEEKNKDNFVYFDILLAHAPTATGDLLETYIVDFNPSVSINLATALPGFAGIRYKYKEHTTGWCTVPPLIYMIDVDGEERVCWDFTGNCDQGKVTVPTPIQIRFCGEYNDIRS